MLWRESIPSLAKRLDVKPWRLWQAAKQHDVPGPPSGTWTLARDGFPMPPATPLSGDPNTSIRLTLGSSRQTANTSEARRVGEEWQITVDTERPLSHRLVKQLVAKLRAKPPKDTFENYRYRQELENNHLYGLLTKPALLQRALATLDALLVALEKRGYQVAAGASGSFSVSIGGVSVGFWIRERLELNPKEIGENTRSFDEAFRKTGKLTLMLRLPYGFPDVRHFDPKPEHSGRLIGDRLKDVIARLEAIAGTTVIKEREAKEAAKEAERQRKRREAREAIQERDAAFRRAHRDRLNHYHRILFRAIKRFQRAHSAELLQAELAELAPTDNRERRLQQWAMTAITERHSRHAVATALLADLGQPRPRKKEHVPWRWDGSLPPFR